MTGFSKSTSAFLLTTIFLLAGPTKGSALDFTNETMSWRSHIAEYTEYLIKTEGGLYHNFCPPRGWKYTVISPREVQITPTYELSSVQLLRDGSGDYPEFDGEENLKHYAEILVRNLPQEAEERGKISVAGPWLHFKNWKSQSVKVDYTLHGRRMTLAMGFCNDPEHPEYQLRWKSNSKAEDYQLIREDMHMSWAGLGELTKDRINELNSSEVVID